MAGIEIATGELMFRPFKLNWEQLSDDFTCDCEVFKNNIYADNWDNWEVHGEAWFSSEEARCPHHAEYIRRVRDNAKIVAVCDFWDRRKHWTRFDR